MVHAVPLSDQVIDAMGKLKMRLYIAMAIVLMQRVASSLVINILFHTYQIYNAGFYADGRLIYVSLYLSLFCSCSYAIHFLFKPNKSKWHSLVWYGVLLLVLIKQKQVFDLNK